MAAPAKLPASEIARVSATVTRSCDLAEGVRARTVLRGDLPPAKLLDLQEKLAEAQRLARELLDDAKDPEPETQATACRWCERVFVCDPSGTTPAQLLELQAKLKDKQREHAKDHLRAVLLYGAPSLRCQALEERALELRRLIFIEQDGDAAVERLREAQELTATPHDAQELAATCFASDERDDRLGAAVRALACVCACRGGVEALAELRDELTEGQLGAHRRLAGEWRGGEWRGGTQLGNLIVGELGVERGPRKGRGAQKGCPVEVFYAAASLGVLLVWSGGAPCLVRATYGLTRTLRIAWADLVGAGVFPDKGRSGYNVTAGTVFGLLARQAACALDRDAPAALAGGVPLARSPSRSPRALASSVRWVEVPGKELGKGAGESAGKGGQNQSKQNKQNKTGIGEARFRSSGSRGTRRTWTQNGRSARSSPWSSARRSRQRSTGSLRRSAEFEG